MTDRERIVQHVAGCRFCRALLAHSHRRRDRALLDAADLLAWQHAENDAEREAFARAAAQRTRFAIGMGGTRADGRFEIPITRLTGKREVRRGRRDT